MDPLGDQFASHVTRVTGLPVAWGEAVGMGLPLLLSQSMSAYAIRVADMPMVAVVFRGDEPPPLAFRKRLYRLLEILGGDRDAFCLVAGHLSPYLRRRLVEMRIPFVIPDRQVFWPTLGYAEATQRARRLQPGPAEDHIGPAAQQLLIALLRRGLTRPASVSTAARSLGYSAMSMSRALKELEGAGLIGSILEGRQRTFDLAGSPEAIWQQALSRMRSPVQKTVRVLQASLPGEVRFLAGESALAELGDLAAPGEPVFATSVRVWSGIGRSLILIPAEDEGTCQVELWRYRPDITSAAGCVDPLSLFLSLREEPDERVQLALDELMGRIEW